MEYEPRAEYDEPIIIDTKYGKIGVKATSADWLYLETLDRLYPHDPAKVQPGLVLFTVEYHVNCHVKRTGDSWAIDRYDNSSAVKGLYMYRKGSFSGDSYTPKAKAKAVEIIESVVIPEYLVIAKSTGAILRAQVVNLKNSCRSAKEDADKAMETAREKARHLIQLENELAEAQYALDRHINA
jgi:hypothetical protein